MSKRKLILPTLRARMGDWTYYISVMTFNEIADRISLTDEIHKNKGLKSLIQREVKDRTKRIVEYLKTQEQRFFNALIIGIYDGNPTYQELDIEKYKNLKEEEIDYLSKTLGILTLSGKEKLFAIDGQHRTKAIKDGIKEKEGLHNEEITVIFLAHKNTQDGLIRTRRLFSTLNRYAKPVSKSEIIAIDEEDNCAIITRNLVEDFPLLQGIIQFNQTRSISVSNKTAFTNIIVLYDFVTAIFTNQNVFGIKVSGEDYVKFTHRRESEEKIKERQNYIESLLTELFEKIPPLNKFLRDKKVDRKSDATSLLFRPIGQNMLYSTLKVGIEHGKKESVVAFFARNDFNLKNDIWKKVFMDEETGRIKTDKALQKYAFQLILINIGIKVSLTQKDKEVFDNFKIDPEKI
ncbi:MAG: DGQHR domain-containing protein [Bacteroidia bacterium]|nr:DGQHR domain-containing protein [Bacteroidia bacterium]